MIRFSANKTAITHSASDWLLAWRSIAASHGRIPSEFTAPHPPPPVADAVPAANPAAKPAASPSRNPRAYPRS
jgi:hypothetical protein